MTGSDRGPHAQVLAVTAPRRARVVRGSFVIGNEGAGGTPVTLKTMNGDVLILIHHR